MEARLLGGVISLRSYWAITNPRLLQRISGTTASVEMENLKDGSPYLFIKVPFIDGTFVGIRVHGDLEEGDIVDISSIVLVFSDNLDGSVSVTSDAIYLGDNMVSCNSDTIRELILKKCSDLIGIQKQKESQELLHRKQVTKKAQFKKNRVTTFLWEKLFFCRCYRCL